MSEEPTVNTATVGRWTLDVTNHIQPFEQWDGINPRDAITAPMFEATLEVDRGTYERLVGTGAATYTVEHTTDHNPWRRRATGWRAWACKLRDGAWWTVQRRVLRRELVETTTITIPNCQIKARDV